MKCMWHYYYIKLHVWQNYLLVYSSLFSLNENDLAILFKLSLEAIGLLFVCLAPQTRHSWWPCAFVSIISTLFPAVPLERYGLIPVFCKRNQIHNARMEGCFMFCSPICDCIFSNMSEWKGSACFIVLVKFTSELIYIFYQEAILFTLDSQL